MATQRRGALGVAALVALTIGSATLGAVEAAAPRAMPSPEVALTPATRIDRTDRAEVRQAYLTRLVPTQSVSTRWTGSVDGCRVGTESLGSRRATIQAVNYYRAMVGVGPVSRDTTLDSNALHAALMMDAQNELSHTPAPGWACWTQTGATAAGKSNLYLTSGSFAGAQSIPAYVIDDGASNRPVGHRRLILDDAVSRMGTGSTTQANALWVMPGSGDPGTDGPTWVAWPPAGHVPAPLVTGTHPAGRPRTLGRWSIQTSSDDHLDVDDARVSAQIDGVALDVTIEHRQTLGPGYTPGSVLVWTLRRADGSRFGVFRPIDVDVRITGLVLNGRTTSRAYTVRLFPVYPPTTPTTDLDPAGRSLTVSWSGARARGAAISGYEVRVYEGDLTPTPFATRRVGAEVDSTTFDLGPGTYYAYVVADSEAGMSAGPRTVYGVALS